MADKNIREELSLNRGWLFFNWTEQDSGPTAHNGAYLSAKTRVNGGPASQDFDDTDWKRLDLPHDFVHENAPEEGLPGFCGCRRRGTAWYRRHFRLDEADRCKNIELRFDGIAVHADVFFNGAPVWSNRCGYTGFRIDVTPMAEYGNFINTIAVRVDASINEGWWYEGGGIYRDTWLIKRSPQHIATDGLYADPRRNKAGKWIVPVEAEIANTGKSDAAVRLSAKLIAPDGTVAAAAESPEVTAELFARTTAKLELNAPENVALWDLENPVLYTVEAVLTGADGTPLDIVTQKCGFRTIAFDAEHGFFLNGRHVKLQGTCNHQDHACVGVAVPKSIERFRILKLKEMGCNAYRCSHNPPSPSLLDLCDELGMLVMDENRHYSTSDEHLRQLEWLVRRDRNHPSVILWSLFNEEPLQGTETGYEMARKMSALVKRLDSTRFTTAAMNGGFLTDCNASMALDVTGINYFIHEYDRYHEIAPGHPVLSSEDTSAVTSRGETATVREKNLLADNDTEAVPWGATQRAAWKAIDEREWMSGGFAWTGFDYRGEPTPYPFPSNVSFFGIVDLCGFPKNSFYFRQAFWRHDLAVLKISTHWNRPEQPGTPVGVTVISSKADTVELFLNGRSFGRQKTDRYEMNAFTVPYEPGEIRAVSYGADGNIVAETSEQTTGAPVALVLEPDRVMIADDGYDTVPVTVYAVDAQGRRVPDASTPVVFEIGGDGVLAGVGNGDENSLESEIIPERRLFNGYAQIMLRSAVGGRAAITLRASAAGLSQAETAIAILPDSADRVYADAPARFRALSGWLRSPFSAERPDPNVTLDGNDMNSWERVGVGTVLKSDARHPYMLLRTDLPEDAAGRKILFRSILGQAEFYAGGTLIGKKESEHIGEARVQLPDSLPDGRLTVLFKTLAENDSCGLLEPVLY